MKRSLASCHCGAVQVSFEMVNGLDGASRCDCSLCRRKNAGAVTALSSDLRVEKGAEVLTLYQFGTGTAKHWFCSACGIHVHHQRRSDPNEMGVNIGCVEELSARASDAAQWTDGVNHPSDQKEG